MCVARISKKSTGRRRGNFHGFNILSKRGQLFFLDLAYLSAGVEDDHFYTIDPQKAIGNGTTSIPRCGNKYG